MSFFAGAGSVILKLMTSFLFWFVLAGVLGIVSIGALWIRKKRKLKFNTIILSDLGEGKMGVENTKAGWFKSRTTFFGLWDYGREEYLKIKDGRKIQAGSSEDYHDVNGRRGLIVYRKSDDNLILVPISKMKVINEQLLLKVAPADFRDASVDIVRQAERETRGKMDQIIQWILLGGIIIFALVSIILITQMVQRGQAEAKDLILQAGECKIKYIQGESP
jgi:hypothetical protein